MAPRLARRRQTLPIRCAASRPRRSCGAQVARRSCAARAPSRPALRRCHACRRRARASRTASRARWRANRSRPTRIRAAPRRCRAAPVVAASEQHACALADVDHLLRIGARQRERLLAEHRLPGGGNGEHLRPVERVWRGKYNRLHRSVGECFFERRNEPQAVPGAEFARSAELGVDAEHEAKLLRLPLDRLDEASSPAPETDDRRVDHCGSIPALRISRVHLAISCLMNAANSSGARGAGSRPSPASFALTSGLARLADTTSCTFATTGFGVLAGATRPYQMRVSKPGKVSAIAGSSGASGVRCGEVTARPFIFPPRTCGTPTAKPPSGKSTWPRTRSVMASGTPL